MSNVYFSAYVPKVFLVARAHSIRPSTILGRVIKRTFRDARRHAAEALGLDRPSRMNPRRAAAVLAWRATRWMHYHRRNVHPDTPRQVAALAKHVSADVFIDKIFPYVSCVIQLDPASLVIQWSLTDFISVKTISSLKLASDNRPGMLLTPCSIGRRTEVAVAGATVSSEKSMSERTVECFSQRWSKATSPSSQAQPSSSPVPRRNNCVSDGWMPKPRGTRSSSLTLKLFSQHARLYITYTDALGAPRALVLRMERSLAEKWQVGLKEIRRSVPRSLHNLAHWRWALACMEAATAKNSTSLRRSEFRYLCMRANIELDQSQLIEAMNVADGERARSSMANLRTRP